MIKLDKKFYVASDRIIDDRIGWRRTTLKEAIEHAEKLLENEPCSKEKWIVQVIRVVRKPKPPMKVEVVK